MTNLFESFKIPELPELSVQMWTVVVVSFLVAVLLVWLSLAMAAAEGAIPRVTRASLNNMMIEAQTNEDDISAIVRMRKIARIHRVKRLIADRYAASSACAFVRILCNLLDGVLVASIASVFKSPLWLTILIGVVISIIVAVISILVRPRSVGAAQPVAKLMRLSRIVLIAIALNPCVRVASDVDMASRKKTY